MDNNLFYVRRADINDDSEYINELSNDKNININDWKLIIQDSKLSVTICNENDEIIGFCAFNNNNNNDNNNNNIIIDTFHELYLINYVSKSSLYDHEILENALQSVFATFSNINIILCKNELFIENMNEYFQFNNNEHRHIYECQRTLFMPKLYIRHGRVEDYDDLVPILDNQSPILKSTYGDFFLADLIESQNYNNKALVGEVNGHAVGIMCVTSDIDVNVLHECFQLEAFCDLEKNIEIENVSSSTSFSQIQRSSSLNLVNGPGKDNVFSITMFCIDESFNGECENFLAAAFAQFPHREYCIITLPHQSSIPPLLSKFTFIPPTPTSTLPHVLYLVHRDSINITPKVYLSTTTTDKNISEINDLLIDVDNKNDIMNAFQDKDSYSLIIKVDNQLAGTIIVEKQSNNNIQELYEKFNVAEFIPLEWQKENSFICLKYFILNPLYDTYTSYILSEVLRLTNSSILCYKMLPDIPVQNILRYFAQIRPQIDALDCIKKPNYSLHILTNRTLNEPSIQINKRIIVIGASDTGLSFIESLLLRPDAYFTSITLISSNNLPFMKRNSILNNDLFDFQEDELSMLNIDRQVRCIADTVTEFDCSTKTITLSNEAILSYDYLVLTPGLQSELYQNNKENNIQSVISCKSPISEEYMSMLCSQYERDSNNVILKPVIVYGDGLNALCAIQGLIQSNIPSNYIVWLRNNLEYNEKWCQNDHLKSEIIDNIRQLGVHILDNNIASLSSTQQDTQARGHGKSYVCGLILNMNSELVSTCSAAKWMKILDENSVQIQSECLVCCEIGTINMNLLKSLSENSLIYDGRLVVDASFKTTDKSVYAGGTVAKFSKRYQLSAWNLSDFNSREIGEEMATSLMNVLENDEQTINENNTIKLPQLGCLAKVYTGTLPGNKKYFHAYKPKVLSYGRSLDTHHKDRQCYLCFDAFGTVNSFTFYGGQYNKIRMLPSLIGVPSEYLNDIMERYDQMEVYDILSFLQGKWALNSIWKHNFASFRHEFRQKIVQELNTQARTLLNTLKDVKNININDEKVTKLLHEATQGDMNSFKKYLNESLITL